MTRRTAYRAAVAVAVGASLLLLWLMGAVGVLGIEGDRADLLYLGVLAMGLSGAVVARFRPAGMARTMAVMVAATAAVAVIALLLGKHEPEHNSVLEVLGLNGMFATLFGVSGWLFRSAATRQDRDVSRG